MAERIYKLSDSLKGTAVWLKEQVITRNVDGRTAIATFIERAEEEKWSVDALFCLLMDSIVKGNQVEFFLKLDTKNTKDRDPIDPLSNRTVKLANNGCNGWSGLSDDMRSLGWNYWGGNVTLVLEAIEIASKKLLRSVEDFTLTELLEATHALGLELSSKSLRAGISECLRLGLIFDCHNKRGGGTGRPAIVYGLVTLEKIMEIAEEQAMKTIYKRHNLKAFLTFDQWQQFAQANHSGREVLNAARAEWTEAQTHIRAIMRGTAKRTLLKRGFSNAAEHRTAFLSAYLLAGGKIMSRRELGGLLGISKSSVSKYLKQAEIRSCPRYHYMSLLSEDELDLLPALGRSCGGHPRLFIALDREKMEARQMYYPEQREAMAKWVRYQLAAGRTLEVEFQQPSYRYVADQALIRETSLQ